MTLRAILSIILMLTFSPLIANATEIQIEQSYARVSSLISKSGAAFMHIINNGPKSDRLIAVRTDAATTPEIHSHILEDGIAKMRRVEGGILIPANGEVVLERGGQHIMMMGLTRSLQHGDVILLTFIFEIAGEISIEVIIDNERQPMVGMDHSNMNN